MDGRFPFHSAPSSTPLFKKGLFWLVFFTATVFAFASLTNLVYASGRINFSTQQEVESAKNTELSSTIQIKFGSNLFDKKDNPISQIFAKLPLVFPGFKLNTIGREFHFTLLYLDGLKLSEVKKIYEMFRALDLETLQKYNLDKPVRIIDPNNIKLTIHGTKSKFLAIVPSKEGIEWFVNFWRFVQDYFPELAERHKQHGNLKNLGDAVFSEEAVHGSLLQYGSNVGISLTEAQEAEMITKAEDLFRKEFAEYYRENGKEASLYLDLKNNCIDLVTAPTSIQSPPVPILSYKLDAEGKPDLKQVVRWKANPVPGSKFGSIVEFKIDDNGEITPNSKVDPNFKDVVGEAKMLPMILDSEFKLRLIPNSIASEAYDIALNRKYLSETKKPAELESENLQRKGQFYLTNMHSATLAPKRSFEVLENARLMGIHSTDKAAIGLGLYASTLQEHIKNPADADLVINSIVRVPDNIQTIEEAEAFASDEFYTEVFEQLRELARQKKIAFSEMRIGSMATLGLAPEDDINARENNPYLTHQDILNGTWKDSNGKIWTIPEMIKKSLDFVKGKVDLFVYNKNGEVIGRCPLSLQFLIGYTWKGENHYLQRNGLKGVPTLMRTAVYDGAESFAIAASISRAKEFFSIQMGNLFPRAIRDLMKSGYGHSESAKKLPPVLAEPLWTPKFAKNFLRFLFLLKQNELRFDKYIFAAVKDILISEGRWQEGYNYGALKDNIINTINRPEFMLLNLLRRNLNDFTEFNLRRQNFTEEQWLTRKQETRDLLTKLRKQILNQKKYNSSKRFSSSLEEFERVFSKAELLESSTEASNYLKIKKNYKVFESFEENLLLLEDTVMTKGIEGVVLSSMDKVFIQTVLGYVPHLYHEYLESRSPQSNFSLQWDLIFMGIEKDTDILKTYRESLGKVSGLSRQEFAKVQEKIFKPKLASNCEKYLRPEKVNK